MIAMLRAAQNAALTFWRMRDARERRFLSVAACFIVCTLYYLLLIAPAISGRSQLNKTLPSLHQQVAQLQALANESAELSSKRAAPFPEMTTASLAQSLTTHGLKATSLTVSEQTAQLRMDSVSFTQTLGLLDELRQNMRVNVVDAKFTALSETDSIDATLTLQQAGKQ